MDTATPKNTHASRARRYGFSSYIISVVILLVGITLTFVVWQLVRQHEDEKARIEFELLFSQTFNSIQHRMKANTQILRGAMGLFSAQHLTGRDVSRVEFKAYIASLKLDERYPGIQGVGFSKLIRPEQLGNHLRTIRAEGFPDYALRPSGERNLYSSIIYLEPFDWRNQRAFGYDMYSEPVRQRAMERARNTGVAALSGRVTLVQETDNEVQAGVLLYLPIYRGSATPVDENQRLDDLVGWAYSPLRMKDLMSNLIERDLPYIKGRIAFSIYDGESANPAALLFSTEEAGRDQASPFRTSRQLEVGGQPWFLTASALPGLRGSENIPQTQIVLASGLSISLLLAFINLMQLRNINVRKQAETLLLQSRSELQEAQRIAHVGNWHLDLATNHIYWSDELYLMQGLNPRSTPPDYTESATLFTPESWERLSSAISHTITSGVSYELELEMVKPDGTHGWMLGRGEAVRDESGSIVAVRGVAADITQRKQAETELKHYKDHLEEEVQTRTADLVLARDAAEAANKAKSVFLTSINHELRTPLNAILGFSNLLRQDTQLRPEQRTNLDIINRSGEHLLTLINDVLEMAKIEAGKTQLNIAPLDFGALVRDVADMMHMRAQEKGLRLLIDQSSEFPRYIKSDEARLRQVLINLVGNAIKFTRQGGVTMRFGIKPHDSKHHLLIEIEDSGIGISSEDQQHLFQPFIQMGALPGDNKGTGLGLAITKQFVQLMGGTISVESTLGTGSLFRVELPFSKVDTSELSELDSSCQGEVAGLASNQPAYRILIVEDQLENQLLLTQLMQRIGLEVKLAEDGKQGVQLFQSWQPHLIWMDRRMPVMDGVEATQLIRQLPGGKDVKIVAVTASALSEEHEEMLTAGMDDFVRKPYRSNEIYDSLTRQLGVRYTYNEMRNNLEKSPSVALTAEMLNVLPPALRSELKAALESLMEERIDTALQQVESHSAALHSALSRLVENFDYPSILKALQANGAETES